MVESARQGGHFFCLYFCSSSVSLARPTPLFFGGLKITDSFRTVFSVCDMNSTDSTIARSHPKTSGFP